MKYILLLCVGLWGYLSVYAQGINFDTISLEQVLERARIEKRLVLVDAAAPWSGSWQKMAIEVLTDRELGKFCNGRFICVRVDMSQPEGKAFQKRYGIKYIPHFLVLSEENVVLHRLQGTISPQDFLDWAERGSKLETSLLYLENLARSGQKMTDKSRVDYYVALRFARELERADSVRNILFQELSLEERTQVECWPLFRNECYGSEYFDYVDEHPDAFRKALGREFIDAYLVKVYKDALQNVIYDGLSEDRSMELMKGIEERMSTNGLSEKDKRIIATWGEEAFAFARKDMEGMVHGIEKLAILGEWANCLWKSAISLGTGNTDSIRVKLGEYTPLVVRNCSKDDIEAWDFYQKFKYLGIPVEVNKQFWQDAFAMAQKTHKPLLVECVKGSDAYFINRNWMWDSPTSRMYLDSVCVSVRIDMEATDVIFLQDRFKVENFPAYFLLDANGEIKHHWEGMIEDEEMFKAEVYTGLEKI